MKTGGKYILSVIVGSLGFALQQSLILSYRLRLMSVLKSIS